MKRQEQTSRLVDYLSTLTDEQVWYFRSSDHPYMGLDRATLHYQLHEERKRRGMAVSNRSGRTLFINPNHEHGNCDYCGDTFTREQFQSHNHD